MGDARAHPRPAFFVIVGHFFPSERGPSPFARHGWEGFLDHAKLMAISAG